MNKNMNQEEKDLLLKDLCARLPYDVKVQVFNCDDSIVYEYFSNTDRNLFYIFVKDYITKFNK